MKRYLYLLHRWVGIALGGIVLIWFASGLLMLYAKPSAISHEQRLAHSKPLHVDASWLSAGAAWAQGGPAGASPEHIRSAQLLEQGGEPVWLFQDRQGKRHIISARTGVAMVTDRARALSIAAHWSDSQPSWISTTERDAATAMMTYDPFRPFHRIALNDAEHTEIYLSAQSGEVVRAFTPIDRVLFWGGSYLHFMRPFDALGLGDLRKPLLTWGALAACLATLIGLWIGLSRWRPGWFGGRRYAEGRTHPYRTFWQRWHFWLGLSGGLITLTWLLSGFFANNPWKLFNTGHKMHAQHEMARYQGGPIPAAALNMPMQQVRAALDQTTQQAVELVWFSLGERAVLRAYNALGQSVPLRSVPETNATLNAPFFDRDALLAAARRVNHDAPIQSAVWLQEYDLYYYPQRRQAQSERPLPVLRVALGDAKDTWLYLDPETGKQIAKFDGSGRVFRWVFRALHTWDIGWLASRPLWDMWMIGTGLIGLALSWSAVVIGWKRLQRKFTPTQSRQPHPSTKPLR